MGKDFFPRKTGPGARFTATWALDAEKIRDNIVIEIAAATDIEIGTGIEIAIGIVIEIVIANAMASPPPDVAAWDNSPLHNVPGPLTWVRSKPYREP